MPLTKLRYVTHCLLIMTRKQKLLFPTINPVVNVSHSQKQKGTANCGLFTIANATAIVYSKNPSKLQFKQEVMRAHLILTTNRCLVNF